MIGGVRRDNRGKIEIAFTRSIGDLTILVTECMMKLQLHKIG